MNDHTWQHETDPLAMLEALFPTRGLDSAEPQSRKSRLYLIACARRAWDRLLGVCRAMARIAEEVYQNNAANKTLRDVVHPHAEALYHCRGNLKDMQDVGRELIQLKLMDATKNRILGQADRQALAAFGHLVYAPFSGAMPAFRQIPLELHSADLVREIFPNPARPVGIDPEWLTSTVLALARGIHLDHAYDRLPILADALQDAGCDDDILNHMRDPKLTHALGCWALELVLDELREPQRRTLSGRLLPT